MDILLIYKKHQWNQNLQMCAWVTIGRWRNLVMRRFIVPLSPALHRWAYVAPVAEQFC